MAFSVFRGALHDVAGGDDLPVAQSLGTSTAISRFGRGGGLLRLRSSDTASAFVGRGSGAMPSASATDTTETELCP
jgi:hypothetical protein